LWDIDHTLIETGGVGRDIYAAAFEQVTGQPLEKMASLSGRTEPVIFGETLHSQGIDAPADLFDRFAEVQACGYVERAEELRHRGRVLPGVPEALRALSARDGLIQSVLTGNTRPSAEAKLRAFGLEHFLDLDSGAYGTDDDIRANLVGIAQRRAGAAYGANFDRAATVLIGDTPNDVIAARDGGALVIAVATGNDTTDDLSAEGPNEVLADLADTAGLLRTIDTLTANH
jgi:phosphoglycolate phosphatase-like HAD superfamily hydrolase